MVAVWPSGSLIQDPYSKASSGEILLSLHVLWNWAIVRSDNFKRLKAVA